MLHNTCRLKNVELPLHTTTAHDTNVSTIIEAYETIIENNNTSRFNILNYMINERTQKHPTLQVARSVLKEQTHYYGYDMSQNLH